MKKLTITLFFGVLLMVPVAVFADHDIAHTIQQLQAKIQELQAQIAKIQGGSQSTPPSQSATAVVTEQPQNIPSFNLDLYFGMRSNPYVTDLQEFLTDQGYYAGPVSGNFGLLTLSAVKKFQSANGIKSTGYFGPRSRTIANEIIQKLVRQICPQEEGCEGSILPIEKIYMTADSGLNGIVGSHLKIGFTVFGGFGNYYIQVIDGDVPGLSKLSGCEINADCPKDKIVLAGTPIKNGVFSITFLVTEFSAKDVYGKERFTIIIKDKASYSQPPVISGIKGPTTLKVGEEGLWTINAYDPQNGNLSYRVVWGDEGSYKASKEAASQAPFKQTTIFSHTYYAAGVYNPIFYVANDGGLEAKTSISVNVDEVITTTVSEQVKCVFKGSTAKQGCSAAATHVVPSGGYIYTGYGCEGIESCVAEVRGQKGDKLSWKSSCDGYTSVRAYTTMDGINEYVEFNCISAVPSIAVLSPNGGETWTKGTTQTIKWRDNTSIPFCPTGATCAVSEPKYYDVKLVTYFQPCTTTICPSYPYIAPYTIANNVYGSSYNWSVGKYLDVLGIGKGDVAPDGSYTIQVCQTSSATCDSSDSYFKIVASATTINSSPVINGIPAIPSDIKIGHSVSFSWGATDADGDNLSWSVSWGEGTGAAGACQLSNPQNKEGWTFTTSHAWQKAGTYTVKATVSDCRGGSDEHSFLLTVN